ncbi:hypothetical protein CTM88_20405 [Photobacterium aquimaris]|uniref:TraD/TraG TraM recognition site domain-containing protein n=1 Tax=Photobacterium aquimaris TaxID=512643 RepID=A0A2T3IEI3_9GAMM|nr:conjugative transfer system coupling protein TraD [Photobacterium aquimaris]OBU17616.1 hypothetical protein AYY20_18905 [Photobacterium aquimaris]PSU22465.1 hypothetical protein CTM88_20405 [Photobacterium aquimaris]
MFKKNNSKSVFDNSKLDNYFREIYELKQFKIWFFSGLFFLINGGWLGLQYFMDSSGHIPDSLSMTIMGMLTCFFMAILRFKQGLPVIQKQIKLSANHLVIESIDTLRVKAEKSQRAYLGTGYRYGPEHSSSMYRIAALPSTRRSISVPALFRPYVKYDEEVTEILGGEPFIMGLGNEQPVTVRHDIYRAHVLMTGLPGTGKTTILKIVALNKLWSNKNCLLVILDPKNTPELRMALKGEMARQGRPQDFHYFAPANASQSIVVDCLANYTRSTEIATRIINTIPGGGSSGDVFKAFCWERVNQIVQAMEFVGEKPTLMRIRHNLREGLDKLVEATIDKYFENQFGDNWFSNLQSRLQALSKDMLEAKCKYYTSVMSRDNPNPSVSGIIDQYTQDPNAVRAKTGSLMAVLEQLCSEPLGRLLSPTDHGVMDNNPRVVNLRDLSQSGGVLYMATDGLTDPIIAGAISKLVSSAVAAASAERYNFGTGDEPEVGFMVDEAHNAICESILDTLAVGRQSKFWLCLSTQSIPDMIEKTSQATADRITGLCANTIAFRSEDKVTREFVAEKFNHADITQESTMRSNATHSSDKFSEYGGGSGVRSQAVERQLFPPWLVGSLPNLQAICSFSNGDKILLRLPVEPRD